MRKIFLILFVALTFQVNAQKINKSGDGYVEVVDTKLSKKELYQKVNEWIAQNYNSAKDVIQLNTEDKVILKGNYKVAFKIDNFSFNYRIHNTLSISIRDNKYKIDLTPSRISTDLISSVDGSVLALYIQPFLDAEVFDAVYEEYSRAGLNAAGYSEKKINKLIPKLMKGRYGEYLVNKNNWDDAIASIFNNLKKFINSADDDW